ncbi:MAG: hypothetical protein ABI654_12170 [Betaproteobacteria bacterium]
MTTSQRTALLVEILESLPIPPTHFEYFQNRLKFRLYAMVQDAFSASKMSKADLAKKLDVDPGLVTRWMNTPTNLELNSLSNLLLAIGCEPILDFQWIRDGAIPPTQEAWLRHDANAVEKESPKELVEFASRAGRVKNFRADRIEENPQDAPIGDSRLRRGAVDYANKHEGATA